MNVRIAHTGSSGNLAVIDDTIVIDAGWSPAGELKGEEKALFLTHCHTDHTKFLSEFGGLPIYALETTAFKLQQGKFPYMAFNELVPGVTVRIQDGAYSYVINPVSLKHDVPCVGFEIMRFDEIGEEECVFYGTDFRAIEDEEAFIKRLRDKYYDALYIECNNTMTPQNMVDIYFPEDDGAPPKDEFHRRRSYDNHCNASYLMDIFTRAGYSESNKFTEPVTFLHKSSYYYHSNPELLVKLANFINIQNIYY